MCGCCTQVASSHSERPGQVGSVQFRRPEHSQSEVMKEVLWRLATKELRSGEWRKLAHHWGFSDAHIKAIEHQYTGIHTSVYMYTVHHERLMLPHLLTSCRDAGSRSYKEHGYRLLLIWLHGVKLDENPMKLLYEALTAVGRRELAGDNARKRLSQCCFEMFQTECIDWLISRSNSTSNRFRFRHTDQRKQQQLRHLVAR